MSKAERQERWVGWWVRGVMGDGGEGGAEDVDVVGEGWRDVVS